MVLAVGDNPLTGRYYVNTGSSMPEARRQQIYPATEVQGHRRSTSRSHHLPTYFLFLTSGSNQCSSILSSAGTSARTGNTESTPQQDSSVHRCRPTNDAFLPALRPQVDASCHQGIPSTACFHHPTSALPYNYETDNCARLQFFILKYWF